MSYASYEYYKNEYLGAVIASSKDFDRAVKRASAFLDYYTNGRVKTQADNDAVKMACCAVAELVNAEEASAKASASGKQSETVGSYSVSYRDGAEASIAIRKQMADIVARYLAGTGLLYRGGCHVHATHCNCL